MDTLILTAGLAGLQAQALGLVEAAGLTPEVRSAVLAPPWRWLPPRLWPGSVAAPVLGATPPPLVVGCGGAGSRLAARARLAGARAVAIQHPRMALRHFDLVFAARHDGIAGRNVVVTRTALHRVTPARLAAARSDWAHDFGALPLPRVAVLLGGANGRYRFGAAEAHDLAAKLRRLQQADGASLLVTPSRRTAPAALAIIRAALDPALSHVWDGTGENPYFGMLAWADAIVATVDSVSMVSEACATAAPVLLHRLPGRSARIGAFMAMLEADGRVRPFEARLTLWDSAPLDDTPWAAAELRRRLDL